MHTDFQNTLTYKQIHDAPFSTSTITREESKGVLQSLTGGVKSAFNGVWGGFKWILSKVFCCFDYTTTWGGKSKLETLKKMQEGAKNGKKALEELIQNHGKGESSRKELSEAWGAKFGQLPEGVRTRLMGCYFGDLAKGKGLSDDKDVKDFVKNSFKGADLRNKALGYVRDLKFAQSAKGGNVDPCDKGELVAYFDQIAKEIEEEIKGLEKA